MEIDSPQDLLKWYGLHAKEIEEIESLLALPLKNEIGMITNHIADLSVRQGVLSRLLADAEALLAFTEQQQLIGRDDDKTDIDRKVALKFATRNEKRMVSILEGFTKALRNKMIATQSLRKTLCGEIATEYL